ncbi:MAG: hypothetical protein JSS43_19745, partial [Proteobacteria bacterium]|nr:hypothetical protein [Pseudomonadota bacterium]
EGFTQGLGNLFQRGGNNNNSFSMSFNRMGNGAESGANMLMQQFINVPDVLTRLQGKACEIELVRDLDLSAAYPKLRSLIEIGNR